EYFHNEVRLARQISHPNICRVYDLGEVDGQHFISMEYIDGEDLKTLLHRIGRLPRSKAVQIAHELCDGLGAAHSKGVLHRDLKLSNVMIDGAGQARITDFGLAATTNKSESTIGMSGTPAYMAPEQLLQGRTSVQSDIYSLGLVLFEICSGESAHDALNLAELRQFHDSGSTCKDISNLAPDIEPGLALAIRECLQGDATQRPQNTSAVAAFLPGSDRIAAAIDAGQLPSAELLAAGPSSTVSFRMATIWAALACFAAVFLLSVSNYVFEINAVNLMSPDRLVERARDYLDHLGYGEANDYAFGWTRYHTDISTDNAEWSNMHFWFRQHTGNFYVSNILDGGRMDAWSPSWEEISVFRHQSGVFLNPVTGNLFLFRGQPKALFRQLGKPAEPRWSEWFPESMVGFQIESMPDGSWVRVPPVPYDHLLTKDGTISEHSDQEYVVTAASFQEGPSYFHVVHKNELPRNRPHATENPLIRHVGLLLLAIGIGMLVFCLFHWMAGRGDRIGARNAALFVSVLSLAQWAVSAHHSSDPLIMVGHLMLCTANIAGRAAFVWFAYIAFEPLVRRVWPRLLVSWSRLVRGRLRDPQVGWDLLRGISLGGVLVTIESIFVLLDAKPPFRMDPTTLLDEMTLLGGYCIHAVGNSISICMTALTLLTIANLLFRVRFVAVGSLWLLVFLLEWQPFEIHVMPFAILAATLSIYGLLRFGAVGLVGIHIGSILLQGPITFDRSNFYFKNSCYCLLFYFSLIAAAWYFAIGGKQGVQKVIARNVR
ncbi:MAG: serine/threonine protein kinase, partial [Planctomycetales bacterium]|nr:serine/threonine protein kinase [Planctomycetales bacterium]